MRLWTFIKPQFHYRVIISKGELYRVITLYNNDYKISNHRISDICNFIIELRAVKYMEMFRQQFWEISYNKAWILTYNGISYKMLSQFGFNWQGHWNGIRRAETFSFDRTNERWKFHRKFGKKGIRRVSVWLMAILWDKYVPRRNLFAEHRRESEKRATRHAISVFFLVLAATISARLFT